MTNRAPFDHRELNKGSVLVRSARPGSTGGCDVCMSNAEPLPGDDLTTALAREAIGIPFENNRVGDDLPRGERLHRLRHSAAHVLAEAALQMFPEARFGAGPAVEHGFYYDIALPRSLVPADLEELERRMKKIAKRGWPLQRAEVPLDRARALFDGAAQPFKGEILAKIAARGESSVTLYRQNQFVDLCAGPHVSSTSRIKYFKLTKLGAAYWQNDATRPMLQRVYGTAWETQEDLDAYLSYLDEAKKRNHKRLGEQLDLFQFHPEAPGAAFWTPRGFTVLQSLLGYWRQQQQRRGYQEIFNPMLYKKDLYITSGHYTHYKEDMFIIAQEDTEYCLKPMNCPDTFLFYTSRKRSFRELPLRIAEGGILHRNELAGALNGLFRVRQFMQDDAHIFVMPDQVEAEIFEVLDIVKEVYSLFGLTYSFTLSTRNPDKFMGEVALWDQAEADLRAALDKGGYSYTVDAGGGAFYGPKIDIRIDDCLGRKWQCATVQLDFQQPINFDMKYTGSDNTAHRPIVIHRAVFGSFERFIGVLLEHTGGALPTWLSPVQAVIVPVSDKAAAYAFDLRDRLRAEGLRAEVDDRTEKMQYKIREAELLKTPYMLVVGEKEAEAGTVSVRTYRQGARPAAGAAEVVAEIAQVVKDRVFDVDVQPLRTFDSDDGDAGSDSGY